MIKKQTLIACLFAAGLSFQFSLPVRAQDPKPPTEEYKEEADDPYIYVPRENYQTSPAYQFSNAQITTRQVNVNVLGENMIGDAANETSIAIDAANPDRMIIGWRQFDTITSNFRQAGFAYSLDRGETWTFPGPIEPGVFRSDPVLDFDQGGNFYYNSLTSGFFCKVFKSADAVSWDEGTDAFGGDKQWMVIDRTGGIGDGQVYAFWKPMISSCSGAFTRSVDGGGSYEECSDLPNPGTRGTLTVGPDGALYACGEDNGSFYVARSSNANNAGEAVAWDLSTTVDMGGNLSIYQGPNPNGMLGQVWIAADHSDGDYQGQVYLLATIDGFSPNDPADVVLTKSPDGGETWSDPIRINDDPDGNYNWFGTLSVAPNGRIDVAWVDTREEPGTYLSALYYSYSEDGGETWSVNQKLSEPFDPHLGFPSQNKIGDYYQMRSDSLGAHLAWAATFNGEEDAYYSYILPEPVTATFEVGLWDELLVVSGVSPNPFRNETRIEYSLNKATDLKIEVTDLLGRQLDVLLDEHQLPGKHAIEWKVGGNEYRSGVYLAKITIAGHAPLLQKMVLVR